MLEGVHTHQRAKICNAIVMNGTSVSYTVPRLSCEVFTRFTICALFSNLLCLPKPGTQCFMRAMMSRFGNITVESEYEIAVSVQHFE